MVGLVGRRGEGVSRDTNGRGWNEVGCGGGREFPTGKRGHVILSIHPVRRFEKSEKNIHTRRFIRIENLDESILSDSIKTSSIFCEKERKNVISLHWFFLFSIFFSLFSFVVQKDFKLRE